MERTYGELTRNLEDSVTSALLQDRERVELAEKDGQNILLVRLIGADGRNVAGLPNPWVMAQAPVGQPMTFAIHDLVTLASKRGARGIVVTGPNIRDEESPENVGVGDSALWDEFRHVIVHGIAFLAIQTTRPGDVWKHRDLVAGKVHPMSIGGFFDAEPCDDDYEHPGDKERFAETRRARASLPVESAQSAQPAFQEKGRYTIAELLGLTQEDLDNMGDDNDAA